MNRTFAQLGIPFSLFAAPACLVRRCGLLLAAVLLAPAAARAQFVWSGRLGIPRLPGSTESLRLGAVHVFASRDGGGAEALGFRSWETDPAGWYRLSGIAGRYTAVFSNPASFPRPVLLTNQFVRGGDAVEREVTPRLDAALLDERDWDRERGHAYWQTFIARGTSITSAGFRVAHDGVDGFGPGAQDLAVSIHRVAGEDPEAWPRIGPDMAVPGVDSGGGKNTIWSAGWNSGEVPVVPGERYALRIAAASPEGTFQPFWARSAPVDGECWRIAGAGGKASRTDCDLWFAVAADGDGLVIPYQKRVHKPFHALAGFEKKWSQTYVARGRGLASVILYAAVSGKQPQLARQRVAVRVRRGGPDGLLVGIEKVAVGNGNYTGDASWGVFGCAFAPGEVALEPGAAYALEFESLESAATIEGFINIKGEVSDGRPGFNPYRKCPTDDYPLGTAYRDGQAMDHDLDLQVVEYEHSAPAWAEAVAAEDLLAKGGLERTFTLEPGTALERLPGAAGEERAARVAAAPDGKADGGFVERVEGLSRAETYRLLGRVRSNWPADADRHCLVGIDPTGQVEDARATTIEWTVLPALHGAFVEMKTEPVRPRAEALSVWLRGRAAKADTPAFRAEFAGFALRRVQAGPPERAAFSP
jgi:hypothetical protein